MEPSLKYSMATLLHPARVSAILRSRSRQPVYSTCRPLRGGRLGASMAWWSSVHGPLAGMKYMIRRVSIRPSRPRAWLAVGLDPRKSNSNQPSMPSSFSRS